MTRILIAALFVLTMGLAMGGCKAEVEKTSSPISLPR